MATIFDTNHNKVKASAQPVINFLNLNALGQIIQTEYQEDNPLAKALDCEHGIDWLIKTPQYGILGIAARIQFTQPNYYHDPHNTFTVRFDNESGYQTEFSKRLLAIQNGNPIPFFTLHAYVQAGNPTKVLSAALVKTTDLYSFLRLHDYMTWMDTANKDSIGNRNTFKVCRWRDVSRAGYYVNMKGDSITWIQS